MTLVSLVLAQCFVMNDPTPGWKQITLPSNAPQLAAPDGYEQFRTADTATVTHELTDVLRNSYRSGMGRQTFDFALPTGTKTVTLRFSQPLHSAKVDAVVEGYRGRMSLLDERRMSGSELVMPIPLPEANRAIVTVHYHLRDVPNLDAATVDRQVVPLSASDFPEKLRLENSFYVLSSGGPLELCQRPAQPMSLSAAALQKPVRSAALTPGK
ncbi:MAG: hypothetical protein Q8L14_16810 [Myxococcales bacterium]|nr:hypothetical protein [Myxococcales bacterium]